MPGIWIAALLTTIVACLVGIPALRRLERSPGGRRLVLALVLFQLPMCGIAWYAVREPFLHDVWLRLASVVHPGLDVVQVKGTTTYKLLRMADAPVGEELAKLWPLLLPWVRRELRSTRPETAGVALGFGFGLGEIWVVASFIAASPALAKLPFWHYGGFLQERLIVCACHGVFTAQAVRMLGRGFPLGVLAGMALHFLGNFPIFFRIVGWPPLSDAVWGQVLALWVIAYAIGLLVLLANQMGSDAKGLRRAVFGRARCRACGAVFDRGLLAMNLGPHLRYEPCTVCKKWQLTRKGDEVTDDAPPTPGG